MSLRIRLTAAYTLFFALALLLLDLALYFGIRQVLINSVLDDLRTGGALLEQAYQREGPQFDNPSVRDVIQSRPQILYAQIFSPNGITVASTGNLRGDALPLTRDQLVEVLQGRETTGVYEVSGTRVLSLLTPLRFGPQVVGVIQVAQSLEQVDRALQALIWALAGGGVLALIAAAFGGLWLTGAALRPIDDVSATAARIVRAEDLEQRVPTVAANDELGRLTRTINEMLARMERSFAAQQRFTADVAHELRTPLAAMRGNLEILRRGAQHDPALLDESLRDVESEVLRLTRMANDLLVLAQADAGVGLRLAPFQLDEVVLEVYREMRMLAGVVQLRVDLHDQVSITGDRDRIKQVLINLVANAIQHTPAGGVVTLGLSQTDTHACLVVQDTGSGIPAEQQTLIFERFYRGDTARTRGGAGLGLSIVKWVAEAHGGQVHVASQLGQGTIFTLDLPHTPDAPATQQDRIAGAPVVQQ